MVSKSQRSFLALVCRLPFLHLTFFLRPVLIINGSSPELVADRETQQAAAFEKEPEASCLNPN